MLSINNDIRPHGAKQARKYERVVRTFCKMWAMAMHGDVVGRKTVKYLVICKLTNV